MDVSGNRLTGVLVLIISLVVAFAVAALFYFLKIEQNENYQNQLHFRELNRYVASLEQNKLSLEAAFDANGRHGKFILHDLVEKYWQVSDELAQLKPSQETLSKIKDCAQTKCTSKDSEIIKSVLNRQSDIVQILNNEIERQKKDTFGGDKNKQEIFSKCMKENNNVLDEAVSLYKCKARADGSQSDLASKDISVALCHGTHKVCLDRRQGAMQTKLMTETLQPRPLSEILQTPSRMIPLVLLVDNNGKVLHKAENIKNDASQHGLRFEYLQQALQKFKKSQTQKSDAPVEAKDNLSTDKIAAGYSGFIDLEIAGTDFRLFIQPWSGIAVDNGAETEMLYLLGLQSHSALIGDKLAVSNSLVLIFTLVLIGLVALLPLLKVRLVSTQQGFSRKDLKVIPLSLAILCVLVSISWFQLLFYQGLKISLDQLAKAAFVDIQHSFSVELTHWKRIAEQQVFLLENELRQADTKTKDISVDSEKLTFLGWVCEKAKVAKMTDCLMKLDNQSISLLEGLYLIDRDNLQVDSLGILASEQQYRDAPYSIKNRDYVKHAKNCNGWQWFHKGAHANCTSTFYVERLRNKLDMRLNTWVGIPRFASIYPGKAESTKAVPEKKDLLIFGGQLQTFLHTVMPKDFRFLVFDNDSGEVLYHSDEWLSKIDNIFADTDNDYHLRNLIKSHNSHAVAVETKYKGKDAVFQIGAIAQNVPWTLVVMYDKSPYRLLNLLSAFSSWSLSFCYLLLLYMLWRLLPGQYQLQLHQLVWFCAGRWQLYRVTSLLLLLNLIFALGCFFVAAEWLWTSLVIVVVLSIGFLCVCRYYASALAFSEQPAQLNKTHPLRDYSVFVLLVLLNFTAIPSAIFSNQTTEYLLYRQAQLQQQFLQSTVKTNQQQMIQYVDQVFDAEIFPNKDKKSALQNTRVNCYPRMLFSADYSTYCTDAKAVSGGGISSQLDPVTVALFSRVVPGQIFFGQLPWQLARLQLPLFSEIWVMQQSATTLAPTRVAEPNQLISRMIQAAPMITHVWTGLLTTFALVMLLLLIRYWLCHRMMGLDRVDNFRINPERRPQPCYKAYNALVRILYPHQNSGQPVYLQLIRPSSATEELISKRHWVSTATAKSQHKCMISGLTPLKVSDLRLPVQPEHLVQQLPEQRPTLLLTGIEPLIWNKAMRLEVLSKLQKLIEDGQLNIVLMLEMSPLFRLTKPQAYDENFPVAEQASAAEREAWVNLFARFIKIYDWVPTKRQQQITDKAADMLWHEASGWPELTHIAIQFLAYHCAVKDTALAEQLQVGVESADAYCETLRKHWRSFEAACKGQQLDDTGAAQAEAIRLSVNKHWSKEQIIDYFNSAAAARYEIKWQLCTIKEKVLLICLLSGDIPNPRNSVPLEHLVRRGYIFYDQGWHIVNDSFGRYIMTAEDPATVRKWLHEIQESLWKYTRIPLFIGLLLLLGLLAYTATDSLQSLMALLATMLGIIPVIFNNISLFKVSASGGN